MNILQYSNDFTGVLLIYSIFSNYFGFWINQIIWDNRNSYHEYSCQYRTKKKSPKQQPAKEDDVIWCPLRILPCLGDPAIHPVILTEECVHRQDRGLRWFVVNRRSRHFSILKAHNIGKHLFVSIYSCDSFKWCQAPLDQSAFLNLNLIGVLGWGQALMESFFLSAVSLSIAVRA